MKQLIIIILSLISVTASAQIAIDTLSTDDLNRMLVEQIERLAEESEDDADFEDILDNYLFLSENPVNLNSDEIELLQELRLINVFQLEALKNYRKFYGDFLSLNELEMVDGFDNNTINIIEPIVYIGTNDAKDKITIRNLARYGKHKIIGRYEQIIEPQSGYADATATEILDSPGQHFLGSPQRLQLRYTYNYRNKIRFGFTAEKDPGELFFTDHVNDTLMDLLGNKATKGFDFYGFHAYANNLGVVKDVALGDYQLSFGQGLTLWSGMSFGKTTEGSSIMKRGRGIKPKASASEADFMRGAAVTLKWKDLYGTLFYSNRMIDANVSTADSLDEIEKITSLQETGYHRTLSELRNRHTICQQAFGGHVAYANSHLELGYTIQHTRISAALQLKPTHYNQFYFQGTNLTNQGVDFRYVRKKIAFFGEASMSDNIAFAGLAGFTAKPAGYINFTLSYRNYGMRYQNLLSNPYGESSRGQGEEACYLGVQLAPAPYWTLLVYTDFFRMKWLTMQVNNPSWGHDYYARIAHQVSRKASWNLVLRSKTKMKNTSNEQVFASYPVFYTKNSVRLSLNYQVAPDWSFGNKADYEHYENGDGLDSHGFFICQDIAFKPLSKPYSLVFRYAIFDTDDYNSRVYAYENDVLYSFSVPAMFGKGMRIYLLGKLTLFDALTLYGRIGSTIYSDTDEISSGPTRIEGRHKTDLKLEAIWKF